MDMRMRSVLRRATQIVVICTITGSAICTISGLVDVAGGRASELIHPGIVIERDTHRPLAAQTVASDHDKETGRSGNCPEYGNTVDADESDADSGEFLIGIPDTLSLYTMVYCANGYHSRVDRRIKNDEDGAPVIPTPVSLNRVAGTDAEINEQREWIERFTAAVTAYALNELAYLHSIDAAAFNDGMSRYQEELAARGQGRAAEALGGLLWAVIEWAGKE